MGDLRRHGVHVMSLHRYSDTYLRFPGPVCQFSVLSQNDREVGADMRIFDEVQIDWSAFQSKRDIEWGTHSMTCNRKAKLEKNIT